MSRVPLLCGSVLLAVVIAAGCATSPAREPGSVTLTENGRAHTRIVVAKDAPPATRHAAEELQHFLAEMSGAEISIVNDKQSRRGDIVLGRNAQQKRFAKDIDFAALGNEGHVLRTKSGRLFIAGGEPRGTMYGVYGLLEDVLGCRWFTPQVNRIPKTASLRVPVLNETHVPALEYREPFTAECREADWAARNRMNSSASQLDEVHGGKVNYFGFVHTFESLVPPDKYFQAHPEYFSLVKGKRLRERSQLCTTNEEVVKIVIEEVRKRMREHPEATVFSVSQNDWYNFCECDKCTAMAKAEGAQIAPVLWLVNRVADAVKDEFPDKLIDTLAYQWTRKPPRTMRPAKNVVVRLCSIECCFAHSFEKCNSPENRAFVQDVEGWSKMCDRLWVWDYVTSFAHYLTPFPNLRVRGDNIRFFAKHHVTGIFEQDVYTTENGEFSGLSGYLGAKLLWNPDYDDRSAINEYLDAVYGAGAGPIRKYLDMLHEHVEKENYHVMIWAAPSEPYLNEDLLAKADALFDEAEAAVAGAPETLARVQTARLSVDYAIIERARQRGDKPYKIDHAHFTVTPQPEFHARAERFFATGERSHIESLRESAQTLADYRKLILPMMENVTLKPRAAARVGKLRAGLRFGYYEGAFNELPDFATLRPAKSGVANAVSLDAAPARDAMALQFTGYIKAPADGVYTIGTRSNDGSRVYIGDSLVVDNGGRHSTRGQTGFIALRKGYYPVRVTYFQAGGASDLEFFYSGPGIEHQIVPVQALWHE